MNQLTDALGNIKLPPVTVKVDEDSIRNLFVAGLLLGAMLLAINVVFKKVSA